MRRLERAGQAKSTAYKEQACEFVWLPAIMDRWVDRESYESWCRALYLILSHAMKACEHDTLRRDNFVRNLSPCSCLKQLKKC